MVPPDGNDELTVDKRLNDVFTVFLNQIVDIAENAAVVPIVSSQIQLGKVRRKTTHHMVADGRCGVVPC